MTTTQRIIGRWSVVELQRRNDGEWKLEYDFEPGEWTIDFHPNGRMTVELHVEGHMCEFCNGSWAHDPVAGYTLFDLDEEPPMHDAIPGESAAGMVFDQTPDGPWLYYFEDKPHARTTREAIIAHLARERHRLSYRE